MSGKLSSAGSKGGPERITPRFDSLQPETPPQPHGVAGCQRTELQTQFYVDTLLEKGCCRLESSPGYGGN